MNKIMSSIKTTYVFLGIFLGMFIMDSLILMGFTPKVDEEIVMMEFGITICIGAYIVTYEK